MRRLSTSKRASVFIVSACGALFLGPSALYSEGDGSACQIPSSFRETLALSDVKISFADRKDGYAIYVSSDNPARKELTKEMIFDLLKAKSEWNGEVHDGYSLGGK